MPEGSGPVGRGAGLAWARARSGSAAFEPGRRLELERNRSYWRKGYPRSEGLVFSFGVSPEEILDRIPQPAGYSLASDLFPADVEALRHEPALHVGLPRERPGS